MARENGQPTARFDQFELLRRLGVLWEGVVWEDGRPTVREPAPDPRKGHGHRSGRPGPAGREPLPVMGPASDMSGERARAVGSLAYPPCRCPRCHRCPGPGRCEGCTRCQQAP